MQRDFIEKIGIHMCSYFSERVVNSYIILAPIVFLYSGKIVLNKYIMSFILGRGRLEFSTLII